MSNVININEVMCKIPNILFEQINNKNDYIASIKYAKNKELTSICTTNSKLVETTHKGFYNYEFYSEKLKKTLFRIKSKYYSESFMIGLCNHFEELLTRIDHSIIIDEILDEEKRYKVFFSFYNIHNVTTKEFDEYIEAHVNETFTERMIIKSLILLSHFRNCTNVDEIVEEFLQDNFVKKKSHKYSLKSDYSVDYHKVYTVFNPTLMFLTLDEINFIKSNNNFHMNMNCVNCYYDYELAIQQIKLVFKLLQIENKASIDKNSAHDDKTLVKNYNDYTVIDYIEHKPTIDPDIKLFANIENNINPLINFVKVDMTIHQHITHNNQLLMNFINNLTIKNYLKIKDELTRDIYSYEYYINEEYFIDYLNNIINDTIVNVTEDKFNNFKDKLLEYDFSAEMAWNNIRALIIDLKMFYHNRNYQPLLKIIIKSIEEKIDDKILVVEDLQFFSRMLQNFLIKNEPFIIHYLTSVLKDNDVIEFIEVINDLNIKMGFDKTIQFVNNYDEYKDLPFAWVAEML